jgi:hypothetical protein
MRRFSLVPALALLCTLYGGGASSPVSAADDQAHYWPLGVEPGGVPALALIQRRWEIGAEPELTRTLVTPRYMRIDSGRPWSDYILFDRLERVIYSVVHESATILVINDNPVTVESPLTLEVTEQLLEDEHVMMVGGAESVHYRLFVNDRQCYDVRSIPGLFDAAAAALGEYRTVLAGQHVEALAMMPVEVMDACDLAVNIFEPDRFLKWGFPVDEWDAIGFRQSLVGIDPAFRADPVLFSLPAAYARFSPGE